MYKHILIILLLQLGKAVSENLGSIDEILLKLVHQAVKPHREILQDAKRLQNYQGINNLHSHNPYLSAIYPHPSDLIPHPPYINRNPQTVREILETIATNDKLRCIPRLLCEITSGSMKLASSKQPSFLNFNIDTESLQQVLNTLNIADVSPVILLGKAAVIGIVSRGNDKQCGASYPNCPNDPDELINYLNNYNGGFFRYFNGLHAGRNPLQRAQERILTKPYNEYSEQIKFPVGINTFAYHPSVHVYKSPKTLVFSDYGGESNRGTFKGSRRKRKGFLFPTEKNNEFIFQKPLANYPVTPPLFPDRTGTGELIIDSEDFF